MFNLVPLHAQVLGRRVPFMLEMLFGAYFAYSWIACRQCRESVLGAASRVAAK